MIWVDAAVVDRLMAMHGPGESYSDVILRIVEIERASESSLADDH
jgi:predicted CopG family antitoxin